MVGWPRSNLVLLLQSPDGTVVLQASGCEGEGQVTRGQGHFLRSAGSKCSEHSVQW